MRGITSAIIILTVIVLAGYDVYALINGGTEATISYILLKASKGNPAIPFAFGFLMGHLFWFNKGGE